MCQNKNKVSELDDLTKFLSFILPKWLSFQKHDLIPILALHFTDFLIQILIRIKKMMTRNKTISSSLTPAKTSRKLSLLYRPMMTKTSIKDSTSMMKVVANGETNWTFCSRVFPYPWALATSGGFHIYATKMAAVRSDTLFNSCNVWSLV